MLIVCCASAGLPALSMVLSPEGEMASLNGLSLVVTGLGLLFNFSTGIISREREQGLLGTIFSHPLKRSTYVFSKWIALSLGVWLLNMGAALLTLLVYIFNRPDLILWSDLINASFSSLMLIAGTASILLFCSAIGSATSELTVFSMLFGAAATAMMIGAAPLLDTRNAEGWMVWVNQAHHMLREICVEVSGPLWFLMFPFVQLPLETGTMMETLFSYASNISLVLLLTVWVVNKREVGYGNA